MQDASTLATAHYPETLDRIFIIGAPAFFPTVWGWVKRWFDPITVSKIFILSQANLLPTLKQYIDIDNIPKKYGGNLDFEWGQMPNLDPVIEAAIKWENPVVQNGKNTFPIGPIAWENGENGALKAVAVGHENGQARRRTVFTIPNPVNGKKSPVVNTPITEQELALTTEGTHTQPPDSEVPDPDTLSPPSDSPSQSSTPTLSAQADSTLPIREGTSDTRYEQQNHTHASGQLAEGTPHAAVNDHGHGDKTVTMEPNTVGQAPKDVSIPTPEPPAPGYMDQAKSVAASASAVVTSTATSAAGAVAGLVGGSAEEKTEQKAPEKSEEEKRLDREIDAKDEPAVEGFLREKSTSVAPQ